MVFYSFLSIYGNILYDQTYNILLYQNQKEQKCNACPAVTVPTLVTSKEKLYKELG